MLIASAAGTWTKCALAGSLDRPGTEHEAVLQPPTDEENDARREGTAGHWVAECVLRGDAGSAADMVDRVAPNGWCITPDLAQHVQGYCDYVRSFGDVATGPETQVELFGLVRGRVDCEISQLPNDGGELVLRTFDLKLGWKVVEAEGHAPSLVYAAALWELNYGIFDRVEIHIYQPRPYHPGGPARVWYMNQAQFAQRCDWLHDRAKDATSPAALGTPGAQCRDCAGRGRCYALAATVYAQHDIVRSRDMVHMTAGELAHELDFIRLAADLATTRCKAVEAEADSRAARGEFLPGWLRDASTGHRIWTKKPETVQAVTGLDPWKRVLKTPAELEREGADVNVVKMMTTAPLGARRLVRASQAVFKKLFPKPPAMPVNMQASDNEPSV